ncbi:MAG TPA: aldehyde dehydrogenase family protein [Solirubrobacteraceae bacterium]
MRDYRLYIGGEDVEGSGWIYQMRVSSIIRDPFALLNRKRALELGTSDEIDDDVVGRCAVSGDDDNRRALQAARSAATEFGRFPLSTRKAILDDFHVELLERRDEFVELLIAEGHPRRLAQWEVSGVLRGGDPRTIEWYAQQLERTHTADGKTLELRRKPDGVVCVNPPQNAAGSNSALGVLAILAGNTLVVKAPRSVPLSVMFVYRDILAPVLEKHGAPAGTLNIVCGGAQRIMQQWIESPLVDDILFFGDSTIGLKVGQECIAHGKKPVLELAGNDGFVVWHDADVQAAARALSECFYGSSQICMVPKYAVVHPDIADALLDALVEQAAQIRPGYPEDPDVLLSPVLKTDKFYDYLAEARGAGCEVLTGGARVDAHGNEAADGLFFEPTVLRVDGLERARDLAAVREETFFPLLPVVVPEKTDDDTLLERFIAFLNANDYGLRNSVWTDDEAVAQRFADGVMNGGLLKINDSHIGFESVLATHGGTGMTGGPFGELNYVGLRTTHLQGIVWGAGDPQPLDPRFTVGGAIAA